MWRQAEPRQIPSGCIGSAVLAFCALPSTDLMMARAVEPPLGEIHHPRGVVKPKTQARRGRPWGSLACDGEECGPRVGRLRGRRGSGERAEEVPRPAGSRTAHGNS
eukprot:3376384-Pyramimonas_sp.AAC.1